MKQLLLEMLEIAQIKIHKQGDRLQVKAPPNNLTPELRQKIADNIASNQ